MPFCLTDPIGGPFQTTRAPTFASLTFFRKTLAQNSYGEVVTSWASNLSLGGDLQPLTGKFIRYLHGDNIEVRAVFITIGNPDVTHGDRCIVSNVQYEVADIDNFGIVQAEIFLKWVRAYASAASGV